MLLDAVDLALLFGMALVGALAFVWLRRLRSRGDVRWRRFRAALLLFITFYTLTAAIIGIVATQIARDEHPRDVIALSTPSMLVICALASACVALRPEFPDP